MTFNIEFHPYLVFALIVAVVLMYIIKKGCEHD